MTYKLMFKKKKPLTVVFSGFVRAKGNADQALNRILREKGMVSHC